MLKYLHIFYFYNLRNLYYMVVFLFFSYSHSRDELHKSGNTDLPGQRSCEREMEKTHETLGIGWIGNTTGYHTESLFNTTNTAFMMAVSLLQNYEYQLE